MNLTITALPKEGKFNTQLFYRADGAVQVGVYTFPEGRLIGFAQNEQGSSWWPNRTAAYTALSNGAPVR